MQPRTAHIPCCISYSCKGPAPTQIYTLSLHDALPISSCALDDAEDNQRRKIRSKAAQERRCSECCHRGQQQPFSAASRSEEHTSELQSLRHLVCRLLLEKKKRGSSECRTRS